MVIKEAFSVTWPQLPQRERWAASKPAEPQPNVTARRPEATHTPRKATGAVEPQAGAWEYLDHTADVQIHSWGRDMREAVGASIVGMMGYMVELPEIAADLEMRVAVSAHDEHSLLYAVLDECLYVFLTETFAAKRAVVTRWDEDGDKRNAEVLLRGGLFIAGQHSQGTEVKAITYSNMQVVRKPDRVDTYVIVDI